SRSSAEPFFRFRLWEAALCAAGLRAQRSRCRTSPTPRCSFRHRPEPHAPPSTTPGKRELRCRLSTIPVYLRSLVTLISRYFTLRQIKADVNGLRSVVDSKHT